ncbi:MAG TPA: sigma-70 family RNA polymerase sigma factor [Polyangiaceae bacterium]|nr:sigma-70 family RNA polymerase sigma factor [Polyangiaceae bacterium]
MMSALEFESIIRESRPQLVRFLARLVGDADAEDVVQVVLSKASDALASFRSESSPRTWLFRIATNAAHDWRRARRDYTQYVEEPDEASEGCTSVEDAHQERQLVRQEMSQCVREVLIRLPESYQTVLALSDCEDLSDRELADVLGVTVGSAKIRLHRARMRMKAELDRDCSFYHDAENNLCCDRKEKSTSRTYPSAGESRPPAERRNTDGVSKTPDQEFTMSTVETLPTKQKHLIGVGAAIAAGCHPCTTSYVSAARAEGACERGVRFALETGLSARQSALSMSADFADQTFERPELDASDREKRAQLGALIRVAAAVANNAATLLPACIEAARALGATDDQLRLAAQIARTTKRGAERETESVLTATLGEDKRSAPCCSDTGAGPCCADPSA